MDNPRLKLIDLDPKLAHAVLTFRCPVCKDTPGEHRIRVTLKGARTIGFQWDWSGTFPNSLTISPSIDAGCWHGFITHGEITC